MTTFATVAGWGFIVIAALVFFLKLMVAYSRCSGGVPLLDGIVVPPLAAAVGASLLARSASVFISVVPFALFVSVAYWIAWRLPRRHK